MKVRRQEAVSPSLLLRVTARPIPLNFSSSAEVLHEQMTTASLLAIDEY